MIEHAIVRFFTGNPLGPGAPETPGKPLGPRRPPMPVNSAIDIE